MAGLEANTLADGLFHAFTFVACLLGLYLLWAATRDGRRVIGRRLLGLMLIGWGGFNLVEGLVDHQLLTVHHVNPDNVVLWDALFLLLGATLVLVGALLARTGGRAEGPAPG